MSSAAGLSTWALDRKGYGSIFDDQIELEAASNDLMRILQLSNVKGR